jgi:hypothetical protein
MVNLGAMFKYVLIYFHAIWKDWLTLISSGGGLGLTLIATFMLPNQQSSQTPLQISFFLIAFLCLFYAGYRVWLTEYQRAEAQSVETEIAEIIFETAEPYSQIYRNPRGDTRSVVRIGVKNIGQKALTFDPFIKPDFLPKELPLLLDNVAPNEQTSVLLHPGQERHFNVASFTDGQDFIEISAPGVYGNERRLNWQAQHDVAIIIRTAEGSPASANFKLYVVGGNVLQMHKVPN